jgi:serine phosphatase RsbU (regulator of sigma subunit)
MDISLCAYHSATGKVKWAGANNPLWIIRNESKEIEVIKADSQPIGRYVTNEPFTSHEIQLNKGDSMYVFSDGYSDQFGGEQGKKYKAAKFKRFLLSITDKDMEIQRTLLSEEFNRWKGDLEQLDDVCVMGVRV